MRPAPARAQPAARPQAVGAVGERAPLLARAGWSAVGGFALGLSLIGAVLHRRHDADHRRTLRAQREANRQLRRANERLALLRAVNHDLASSASLDDILDRGAAFVQRLVPGGAVALVLTDAAGPVVVRVVGAGADDIERWRHATPGSASRDDERSPFPMPGAGAAGVRSVVLPLDDGGDRIGWVEVYLTGDHELPADDLALLGTIVSEAAEAIGSARRRTREERRLFELERAIVDERARIARDIHDGLAQTLAFERMRVDLWLDWIEDDPERLRGELLGFKDGLRDQIGELRRAIFALRPVPFDELGFMGGLHRYAMEFAAQHGWRLEIDTAGAPADLPGDLEAATFRMLQESLTNVAKHAEASRVWVRVAEAGGGLEVVVRDDGRGFAATDGTVLDHDRPGLGLRQMRERLEALRGRLAVAGSPGSGTELRAWIPLAGTAAVGGPRAEEDPGHGPAAARR